MNIFQRLIINRIEQYQAKGGGEEKFRVTCNFEPSCSEYTRQAVARFGVVNGLRRGLQRIRRCNHPDLVMPIIDHLPPR
jgi:hypothetical protein